MPYKENVYVLIALLIGAALGFLRRRHAIGGWLFYFFFVIYLNLASVLITIRPALRALDAGHWPSTSLYHWFMVATLPIEVLFLAIAIAAMSLSFTKTEKRLKILRILIFVNIFVAMICGTLVVFQPALALLSIPNFVSVVSSVLWTLYFIYSVRVKRVFVTHYWSEYPPVKS